MALYKYCIIIIIIIIIPNRIRVFFQEPNRNRTEIKKSIPHIPIHNLVGPLLTAMPNMHGSPLL